MQRESFVETVERLERTRFARPLVRIAREHLTPAGRAFVVLALAAAILGQASVRHSPIAQMFAFAAAALAVSWLLSLRALGPVRLRRLAVPSVSAGEEIPIEIEVENLSRRIAHDVTLHELDLPDGLAAVPGEASSFVRLGPGERATGVVRVKASKRGAYVLAGLAASSSFPLGLLRSIRRDREQKPVLVYPTFRTPEHFPVPEGRNYQPGGFLLSSSVGESSEFMHTREYREGDNPKHVHWASTARLGRPVVKVYHEEYFVRLALVVDTEVRPGTSDLAFEWAVSTAAGIADCLSRREYIIDIFAAGPRVYHFQAGRALAHFDHILQILACLDPASRVDWEALAESMLPEAPRLTGVVALLMDWSPERESFVAALEAQGVAVRVLVVRDGATTRPPPPRPPESFLVLAPGVEAA